ncbi:MAG: zinc dependent phospholipase C family protein [Polaromonas sp.]|nr:zinc dependent phospholipase C family protein [Polaromonas sp.]
MNALDGHVGNALRLGAIGPDLTLFLLDPIEDNSFVLGGLRTGLKAYGEFRKIRDSVDELKSRLGEPVTGLDKWLTGGLNIRLAETASLATHAFISSLKLIAFGKHNVRVPNPFADMDADFASKMFKGQLPGWFQQPFFDLSPELNLDSSKITSPAYIFRYFGAPYTNDPPFKEPATPGSYEKNWWWMDILHYRRTTSFARRLLELAEESGDKLLIAYALGYFSHVGGDVVGHPYINSMVGGPFRNHALRHMVIESLLDVHIWGERKGEEIMNARLDKKIHLDDGEIARISNLLHRAMSDVFVNASDPIYTSNFSKQAPSSTALTDAYNLLKEYLAFSTDIGLTRPEPPTTDLGEIWDDLRENLQASVDQVNRYARDMSGASGWDWLAALIGLAIASAALVIKIITLPAAIATALIAKFPEWFLYLLNTALFDFITNARFAMAICGWGYASKEDLRRSISQELLAVKSQADHDMAYPYAMPPRDDGFWLRHPRGVADIEHPMTIPGPYRASTTASMFIGGGRDALLFDDSHKFLLEALASPPPSSKADGTWSRDMLKEILQQDRNSQFFGNAIDFSVSLIQKKFPDGLFDLDGDRGYASTQWDDPSNPRHVP